MTDIQTMRKLINEGSDARRRLEAEMRKTMDETFGEDWSEHVELIPTLSGYHYVVKDARGATIVDEIARNMP